MPEQICPLHSEHCPECSSDGRNVPGPLFDSDFYLTGWCENAWHTHLYDPASGTYTARP